jgi:hypothetical protein
MTERAPDVIVENQKGLVLFRPVTPAGRAWLETHVQVEPWQWQEGVLVVDGQDRGQAIMTGLLNAGLQVGDALGETQRWTDNGERLH